MDKATYIKEELKKLHEDQKQGFDSEVRRICIDRLEKGWICENPDCFRPLTERVVIYSKSHFDGHTLCYDHQRIGRLPGAT